MRLSRAALLLVFVLVTQFAFAQQTATTATQSSPQAPALLQNSLAALTGGRSITDITLAGTVRRDLMEWTHPGSCDKR